jgi:phage shock protein A
MLTQLIIGLIALIVMLDFFTGFKLTKSIFNRLRKKASDAAEAVRDPIADAEAALVDIKRKKGEMVDLRRSLLVSIGQSKKRKENAEKEAEKYEKLAKLAGQAGKVEDVRLALNKKASAEQVFDRAETEVAKLSKQEDDLEEKIKELENLITKAESDKEHLATSLKINKFDIAVNSTLKDGAGEAQSALKRLELDVMRTSIEAEVTGTMSDESKSLEERYESKNGVSDADIEKYLTKA